MTTSNVVGMSWYTPESWAQMRAIADDRQNLTYTFDEFVANAEKHIAEFNKRGIVVEKLMIDVAELVRWCRREGHRVDKHSRVLFGLHLTALRDMPAEGKT